LNCWEKEAVPRHLESILPMMERKLLGVRSLGAFSDGDDQSCVVRLPKASATLKENQIDPEGWNQRNDISKRKKFNKIWQKEKKKGRRKGARG
jgi:hypothetical protein